MGLRPGLLNSLWPKFDAALRTSTCFLRSPVRRVTARLAEHGACCRIVCIRGRVGAWTSLCEDALARSRCPVGCLDCSLFGNIGDAEISLAYAAMVSPRVPIRLLGRVRAHTQTVDKI
jgi:hypothetical protein